MRARTEYGHDILGRLTSVRTGTSATPKSIQDLEYAWRSNGILQFRRDLHNGGAATWTETFTYDNLDRTTVATTSGASSRTLDFGYDSLGNVTNKTSNIGSDLDVTSFSYTVHRLDGATIGAVNYTFAYDTAGNITDYVPGSGDATKLDYDARGQVTRITVGPTASPTARDEFWYDPDGDRFLKRTTWKEGAATQTGWVLYLFGGTFEQSRVVGDTAISYRNQVHVTETVVHRRTQPVSGSATNLIEYRHRDHLGSVDVATNASGAITSTLAFDPFGGRRAANWTSDVTTAERSAILGSASTTARGFTDHEHLDRTGFIHMNGRVYDPRTGRFVQPDPIVQAPGYSQSYNRYAYTFNSPMSFTDPSGFQSSPDDFPRNNWTTCLSFENCLVLDFNSSPVPRTPVELSAEQIDELLEMEESRYRFQAAEPTVRSTVGPLLLPPANLWSPPSGLPTLVVPENYASQVGLRAQIVGLISAPFEFNNVRTLADGTREWFAGISRRGHEMWHSESSRFWGNQYTRLKSTALGIARTARAFGTATFGIGTVVGGYDVIDGVVSDDYGRAALGAADVSVGAGALVVGGPPGWFIGGSYTILKEGVPRSIAVEVELCKEGACPVLYGP